MTAATGPLLQAGPLPPPPRSVAPAGDGALQNGAYSGGSEVQCLVLPDGRALAYACLGAPLASAKLACMYYHGVPACLLEAEPLAAAGDPLGVALVAFDRSGMGGSSPNPAMSLASVAEDAAQLMNFLGLQAAVQVGESGGAPYAAAFAVLHPERTQQLVLLAGLAATDGREHARLRNCLSAMDRLSMHSRQPGLPWAINRVVKLAADKAPESVKQGAGCSLGPADAAYLKGNQPAKDWLVRFMQRAYKPGVKGVLQDYRALGGNWGLDLRRVQARTVIWHGSSDQIVPPSHSEWYCSLIPRAELHPMEGEGHVSLVGRHGGAILQDVLLHSMEGGGSSGPTEQEKGDSEGEPKA